MLTRPMAFSAGALHTPASPRTHGTTPRRAAAMTERYCRPSRGSRAQRGEKNQSSRSNRRLANVRAARQRSPERVSAALLNAAARRSHPRLGRPDPTVARCSCRQGSPPSLPLFLQRCLSRSQPPSPRRHHFIKGVFYFFALFPPLSHTCVSFLPPPRLLDCLLHSTSTSQSGAYAHVTSSRTHWGGEKKIIRYFLPI